MGVGDIPSRMYFKVLKKVCCVDDRTLAECECGSSWFRLEGDATAGANNLKGGAIAFDEMGSVAAWSGTPVCIECGEVATLGARSVSAPVIQLRR